VGTIRFSRRAESDLLSIGKYTLETWGSVQAARYIGELENCCQGLAINPSLGRQCDEVRPGLRRLEHGKHVIFYREVREGILVSRFLHQRMLPDRHAIDDHDNEPTP
jgi:toxin ParE1/3/4